MSVARSELRPAKLEAAACFHRNWDGLGEQTLSVREPLPCQLGGRRNARLSLTSSIMNQRYPTPWLRQFGKTVSRCVTGFMFLLMLTMVARAGKFERERIRLDGEWDFTYQRSTVVEIPSLPPAGSYQSKIEVPGWWDDQLGRFTSADWYATAEFRTAMGPVRYLAGTGWYRRSIDVPQDWQGRPVTLAIGRAVTVVNVWLNGNHLGNYDHGVYTPFQVDLSGHLKHGQRNEIVIAVDNTKGMGGAWAHLGNAGRASGISQSVTLDIAAGSGRIRDLFVTPGDDLDVVCWQVELETLREQPSPASRIEWEVWDTGGAHQLAQGTIMVPAFVQATQWTWSARIAGLQPWSDRQPNLYQTRLRWLDADGDALDTHEQRFGLRRYTLQERKLFLNGKPLYLRGSFGHYYFPQHTTPPTDKEYWRKVFRRVKSLGFNFVNFAAQVAPEGMLEAADEEGIILQFGDHQTVLQEHRDKYQEVWTPIVRWTRRHPSVAIYGFGGERNYYEGIIEQYQQQHDLIKDLHPGALVMPQQAIRGIDYSFDAQGRTELTLKPFPHHAERLARYTKAADLFGHYSGRAMTYTYDEPPHWPEMDERFRIYQKPLVHHELFMGASYLRPENAQYYTGRTPPYLYESLEQRLRAADRLDKWPVYFRNSARLQEITLKFNVEKVRKAHELAGFELLGVYDMHFTPHYAVGLLDEFLRFKTEANEQSILRFNGESVLLIDYDDSASLNRAYYENTAFAADAYLSDFAAEDFGGGTFEWKLRDGGNTVAEGAFPVDAIKAGQVVKLRRIEFTWPRVRSTTKLNLSFRLAGPGTELANDWDFWVFPRRPPPAIAAVVDAQLQPLLEQRYARLNQPDSVRAPQLRVVSRLGIQELDFLTQGGDVVLLGTHPFRIHSGYNRFRPGLGGRPQHNVGSLIADHPVFADLPHEGWGDWHFYSILNGADPFLMDDDTMGKGDPIIEIISSAADIRNQAVIFERRVGKGRLLASSSPVNLENPATVALLDGLLRYAASPAFAPSVALNVEALRYDIVGPKAAAPNNLLPAADFENRLDVLASWQTYGAGFELDRDIAHTGKGSMRIRITPEELAREPRRYVGAVAPTIELNQTPAEVRFLAWYKTDAVSGTVGRDFLFSIELGLADGQSRRVRVPMQTGTADWRQIEHTWRPDAEIRTMKLHVGMANKTGTAWIDEVFLGPAKRAEVILAAATEVNWSREPVTLQLARGASHRIDGGPWTAASKVTISQEGTTRVAIRTAAGPTTEEVQWVRIDATPPTIELSARPPLDQAGGEYIATRSTTFQLTASDTLSGVARIEYRINQGEYQTYDGPFMLPPGRHGIAVRASDRAGNVSTRISGEMITGGETALLIVLIP